MKRIVSGQTLLLVGSAHRGGGRRSRIRAAAAPPASILRDNSCCPGFIDVQVNGGGGVLFNDDPSPESIRAIGAAHRRFGTTGFLPTLISDDLDTIARAIAAVQACARCTACPAFSAFISRGRSSTGRAAACTTRSICGGSTTALFRCLCSLRGGRTVLTLAPEMTTPRHDRAACRRGHPGVRRTQRCELCARPPRPSRTACAASRTCSMPWRRWRRASRASSARRCTMRTPGAASSSTATTSIRSC